MLRKLKVPRWLRGAVWVKLLLCSSRPRSAPRVTVHFDAGAFSSKTEAFLAHKPKTKLRSLALAQQLGIELALMGTV